MRLLALGVIAQAIRDLHSSDKLKRLDAYLFLTDDVFVWLDELGLDYDPVTWLAWVEVGCPRRMKATRARVKSLLQIRGVKAGSFVKELISL